MPAEPHRSFTTNNVPDFRGLFIVPCATATIAAIALALFFRPPASKEAIQAPAQGEKVKA